MTLGKEAYIDISNIVIGGRHRGFNEQQAQELALTIGKNGLTHAITVRPLEGGKFSLVAGRHRIRAFEILGIDKIRCFVRELTDKNALIIEVEENLFGSTLNKLDRITGAQICREFYEEVYGVNSHGGDRKSDDAKIKSQSLAFDRYTAVLAEKSGRSESSIKEDAAIAKRLSPDAVKLLSGTEIANNGSQLKALSKLEPDNQIAIAKLINSGDAKSVSEGKAKLSGKPPVEVAPKEVWNRRMLALWSAGGKRWQDAFLAEIGAVRK